MTLFNAHHIIFSLFLFSCLDWEPSTQHFQPLLDLASVHLALHYTMQHVQTEMHFDQDTRLGLTSLVHQE